MLSSAAMLLPAVSWCNNNDLMACFCISALTYKNKSIYTSSIHTGSIISCATADCIQSYANADCSAPLKVRCFICKCCRLSFISALTTLLLVLKPWQRIAMYAAGTTTAPSYGYGYVMQRRWNTLVTIVYLLQLTTNTTMNQQTIQQNLQQLRASTNNLFVVWQTPINIVHNVISNYLSTIAN